MVAFLAYSFLFNNPSTSAKGKRNYFGHFREVILLTIGVQNGCFKNRPTLFVVNRVESNETQHLNTCAGFSSLCGFLNYCSDDGGKVNRNIKGSMYFIVQLTHKRSSD